MSLNNVKYLLLSISFSVILFVISSSLYLVRSNYNKTYAIIQKSNCYYSNKSNEYICDLTVVYQIDNDLIVNEIIIKSVKPYKIGEIIEIDYDVNNYYNISYETYYKKYALLTSLSGILLLFSAFYLFNEIKENTLDKINNLFDFFTKINV
jgi:hypothetical protein